MKQKLENMPSNEPSATTIGKTINYSVTRLTPKAILKEDLIDATYGTKYSRVDQIKFVADSL